MNGDDQNTRATSHEDHDGSRSSPAEPGRPRAKDSWDKLDIVLKPAGAILGSITLAALGYFATSFVEQRQMQESNLRLYTELMSKRQEAENALRKDMFQQILAQFLRTPAATSAQQPLPGSRSGTGPAGVGTVPTVLSSGTQHTPPHPKLKEVRQDILRLELITRNFHEFLDIKPLFIHVLREIVENARQARARCERPAASSSSASNDGAAPPGYGLRFASARHDGVPGSTASRASWRVDPPGTSTVKGGESKKEPECELARDFWRELKTLRGIAGRIRHKQLAVLEEAGATADLTFAYPVSGKIATNFSPRTLDSKDDHCFAAPRESTQSADAAEARGVLMSRELTLPGGFKRRFDICVRHAYPSWNMARVHVRAPRLGLETESDNGAAVPRGSLDDETWTFWVGSFDFPLVDNTYLSATERFTIAVDDFEPSGRFQDEPGSFKLKLVYFPASFAGLQEKSLNHQRMVQTLIERIDGLSGKAR